MWYQEARMANTVCVCVCVGGGGLWGGGWGGIVQLSSAQPPSCPLHVHTVASTTSKQVYTYNSNTSLACTHTHTHTHNTARRGRPRIIGIRDGGRWHGAANVSRRRGRGDEWEATAQRRVSRAGAAAGISPLGPRPAALPSCHLPLSSRQGCAAASILSFGSFDT